MKMTAVYKYEKHVKCSKKVLTFMLFEMVYPVYIGCKVIELVLLSLSPFERFATNNNCK